MKITLVLFVRRFFWLVHWTRKKKPNTACIGLLYYLSHSFYVLDVYICRENTC